MQQLISVGESIAANYNNQRNPLSSFSGTKIFRFLIASNAESPACLCLRGLRRHSHGGRCNFRERRPWPWLYLGLSHFAYYEIAKMGVTRNSLYGLRHGLCKSPNYTKYCIWCHLLFGVTQSYIYFTTHTYFIK